MRLEHRRSCRRGEPIRPGRGKGSIARRISSQIGSSPMTTTDPTTNAPTYRAGADAPRRTAEAKSDFKTTETKSAFKTTDSSSLCSACSAC